LSEKNWEWTMNDNLGADIHYWASSPQLIPTNIYSSTVHTFSQHSLLFGCKILITKFPTIFAFSIFLVY
jgi:hypothetical protein